MSASELGLEDQRYPLTVREGESTAHLEPSAAPAAESQPFPIRPLGDQIIIRLIQPEAVGSILLPDSSKRITHQGEDTYDTSQELQYVNRWLFEDMTESMKRIAAGVKIEKDDKVLLKDLAERANRALLPKEAKGIIPENGAGLNFVEAEVVAVGPGRLGLDPELLNDVMLFFQAFAEDSTVPVPYAEFIERFIKRLYIRVQLSVKPGDRILYHPAVQRFDRQIDSGDGETYFIIREDSVLAVLGEDE